MNPSDAAEVLTLIATIDNRSFNEATAIVWADALEGLEKGDCIDAVRMHRRQSTEWIMPVHLRRLLRPVLQERRDRQHNATLAAEQQRAVTAAGPDGQAKAEERAASIRRLIADASRMPEPENPHPPVDTRLAMAARAIPCGWCGAAAGEGCSNTTTKRPLATTHSKRLEAAAAAAMA